MIFMTSHFCNMYWFEYPILHIFSYKSTHLGPNRSQWLHLRPKWLHLSALGTPWGASWNLILALWELLGTPWHTLWPVLEALSHIFFNFEIPGALPGYVFL